MLKLVKAADEEVQAGGGKLGPPQLPDSEKIILACRKEFKAWRAAYCSQAAAMRRRRLQCGGVACSAGRGVSERSGRLASRDVDVHRGVSIHRELSSFLFPHLRLSILTRSS